MDTTQFDRFSTVLRHLELSGRALPRELLMQSEGRWATYYAPFDYVNVSARVVLVGITPGIAQALNALRAAQSGLNAGLPTDQILKRAKVFASFSGPMRSNLTAMMDEIGLHTRLEIATTAELFTTHSHLVHFTSALCYPVMLDNENYGGTGIVTHPYARSQLHWFESEARVLGNALFVPLGPAPTQVLEHLCTRAVISSSQVLGGLPHPSGANNERIAYFLRKKLRSALSAKVDPDKLDRARDRLREQLTSLTWKPAGPPCDPGSI